MTSPGWLTRSLADVPTDDGWLGAREVEVLPGLRFEKRRADWRLGRFASKAAVAIWLGVPPGRVEVAAAPDGLSVTQPSGGARARCGGRSGPSAGWWRAEPGWVMAVVGEPAPGRPRALDD